MSVRDRMLWSGRSDEEIERSVELMKQIREKRHTVELQSETCCDECMDIIHNHFDCPICKDDYAGTTIYGVLEDYDDKEFSCEECDSEFTIIDKRINCIVIEQKEK